MAMMGLTQWHLVLGEAGLTRSLLSSFPTALQTQIRGAIASLDRIALETLPLSPELRDRAMLLMDLRGNPSDVLQQVSTLDLDTTQRAIVNTLKSLIELLQASFANWKTTFIPNLVLDLSLIQTFDYYTGIVFEVVAGGATGQRVLGQGGRYDQLLGLYHPQGKTLPGVGFSLNLEDLHQVLLSTGQLPLQTPTSHWLVVPKSPQAYAAAFTYAHKIRESTNLVRVEMDLGGQDTPDDLRNDARHRGVSQIAWIDADGQPEIETLAK